MIAVIPAAGMATRLRPLTSDTPKCLLPVKGMPILGHALKAFADCGIAEFVIVTGYLADSIRDYVITEFPDLTVHFVHNPVYESTNNIYSLYLARPYAEGEDMILIDSDIIFDPAILKNIIESEAPDALALSKHPCGDEEVKVALDSHGFVKEISKTVPLEFTAGESVGIEKMSASYTETLYPVLHDMVSGEGLDNVFYELAFERLIPLGHTFKAIDIAPYNAMEIDTPEDYYAIK